MNEQDMERDTRDTRDTREARILGEAEAFVRAELAGESSGHDFGHIARVRRLAEVIAREEGADAFLCALAALLHDIADPKIAGDEAVGLAKVRRWLVGHGADDAQPGATERVMEIIATMSFRGGGRAPMTTLEGRVVQDADRLDAIGAVGIARAFAYGGAHGRPLYDAEARPRVAMTYEEYRDGNTPTITHFYEKLLLLKDRMNTPHARRLAEERHRFMEAFLAQFAAEQAGEA